MIFGDTTDKYTRYYIECHTRTQVSQGRPVRRELDERVKSVRRKNAPVSVPPG